MELLLTAFVGTAAEELVKGIEGCTVLLLPNDKKADGVLRYSPCLGAKATNQG